jgi:hypothetical protein
MLDMEEAKKFPLYIDVRLKPFRGYMRYGAAQHSLEKMGYLCTDMFEDYEPFRFNLQLYRRRKLKAQLYFRNQAEKDSFQEDDRFSNLLFEINRFCKPRKIVVSS